MHPDTSLPGEAREVHIRRPTFPLTKWTSGTTLSDAPRDSHDDGALLVIHPVPPMTEPRNRDFSRSMAPKKKLDSEKNGLLSFGLKSLLIVHHVCAMGL